MDVVRRISLFATAGLLCVAMMLGSVSARPSVSASAVSELAAATSYFDSTIAIARSSRPTGPRGDQLTIALGYLERLRVGTGSPFRLVDEALHDPRGDSASNARVAWAVLGRLRRGDAYEIDPNVLDGSGPWSHDGHGATGDAHIALIEHAITHASDPRAGELAVRLAYLIEASKGTIAMSTPDVANEVAALVRDRVLATEDLADLLSDAAVTHGSVMKAVLDRRASRDLRVEQPAMAPLDANLRTEAMNAVPALVAQLDTLDRVAPSAARDTTVSILTNHFAERLTAIGARRPTIAQIVVTLRGHPRATLSATNEETLVAQSVLWAGTDTAARANALAVLAGAVAMRVYNQDAPWFAGSPGPEVSDLAAEFGLGSVTFARGVPAAWRPYYLRQLRDGLRDMQQVFPALSVVGLNVSFGTGGLPDSALAMHDPRSRTLQLAINTSGGTVAHELAHDLDWQTSRRLFARAGGYSTDRAVREHRGPLASSVRELADARSSRSMSGNGASSVSDRPAEIFARGVDWFVSSSLATLGRSNGFLSAVQDPSLPGYAAGSPTAIGSAGTSSLVTAIDQMTYISDSIQTAFETTWADPSAIDPVLLVRRVLAAPVPRVVFGPRSSLVSMLPTLHPSLCVAGRSDESRARERIAMLAVKARAKGIVERRARYRFPGGRSDWANGLLGVAPWSRDGADGLVASVESAIIGELRNASADQGVIDAVPAAFRSNEPGCIPLPR